MGKEIERKFLVRSDEWRQSIKEVAFIRQGYLSIAKERVVRLRSTGEKAYLTIKGITEGITRLEYEYEIPRVDAEEMLLQICLKPLIEKKRNEIEFQGNLWVIDEFLGENQGLTVAEIELKFPGQDFKKPQWLGYEITSDSRYFNSNLVIHPFSRWHVA